MVSAVNHPPWAITHTPRPIVKSGPCDQLQGLSHLDERQTSVAILLPTCTLSQTNPKIRYARVSPSRFALPPESESALSTSKQATNSHPPQPPKPIKPNNTSHENQTGETANTHPNQANRPDSPTLSILQ